MVISIGENFRHLCDHIVSIVNDNDQLNFDKQLNEPFQCNDDIVLIVDRLRKVKEKNRRKKILPRIIDYCLETDRPVAIEQLIEYNVINVNESIDKYQWKLLHRAVYFRAASLVHNLIVRGADITTTEINGNTALHIAVQNSQFPVGNQITGDHDVSLARLIETIKVLLKCETSKDSQPSNLSKKLVNMKNKFSKTALDYCVQLEFNGMTEKILHLLLENGADVNSIDQFGRTPLYHVMKAARSLDDRNKQRHSKLIAILLDYNCDKLNLDSLENHVPSLKQICRQNIQSLSTDLNFEHFKNILPDTLIQYLSRRLVE